MKYKVGDMVKVIDSSRGHGLSRGGVYKIDGFRVSNTLGVVGYVVNGVGISENEIVLAQMLNVGEKYTSLSGYEWECIFVEDGLAWLRGGKDHAAYIWNALTGENISQGGGEYNIAFTETRKGTVEYVNGKPDFSTWTEDD